MSKKVIAITGGIGVGKSVVCNILKHLGYNIYDCDNNAKKLMDNSLTIKQRLAQEISPNVIINGQIDRVVLSNIVFNDKNALNKLNDIVHQEVLNDISFWIKESKNTTLFIETAILYQSGLNNIVDEVWDVTAPRELRISRVMHRNNISKKDVEARIKSQCIDIKKPHPNIKEIINDNYIAILPQILKLLY